MMDADEKTRLDNLRKRAEEILGSQQQDIQQRTKEEIQHAFHELSVYQIELEMQNENLRRTQLELEISQENYFNLFEFSPDGFVVLSRKGLILQANLTFSKLLATDRAEIIQKPLSAYIHFDDQDLYYKSRSKLLEDNKPLLIELRMLKSDSAFFWAAASMRIYNENGSSLIWLTITDIHKDKLLQEQVQHSKTELQDTFDAIQDWISLVDLQGTILRANKGAEKILGLPMQQIIDRKCCELMHGSEYPIEGCPMRRMLDTHRREELEYYDAQNQRWLKFEANPIYNDGDLIGAVHIVSDITRRKQAESDLQRSEHLLKISQQLSKVGGWLYDVQQDEMFWTDEMYAIHGISPGNIEPRSAAYIQKSITCYEDQDRPLIMGAFENCVENGTPYSLEVPFTAFDGRQKWVRTAAYADLQDGRITMVYGNLMDITESRRTHQALIESERKLKDAQGLAKIGSWEYDPATDTIIWSDEVYAIYERDPALGPPSPEEEFQYYPLEQASSTRMLKDKALKEGRSFEHDLMLVLPEGRKKHISATLHPLKDEQGKSVRLFGTVQDITARKALEESLRRNEMYLNEAQSIARIGSWTFGAKSGKVTWSPEMYHIFGLDPGQETPSWEAHQNFIHPHDWPELDHLVQTAWRQSEPYSMEFRFFHPDGRLRWGWVITKIDKDEQGKLVELRGTVQDITERKAIEEALLTSEQFLSEAQSIARLGNWVLDLENRQLHWSEEMYRIFSLDPARGAPTWAQIETLIHPEDWPRLDAATQQAHEDGTPYELEFRIMSTDGSLKWVWDKCLTRMVENGRLLEMRGITQDITARKSIEEELRRSEASLKEAQSIAKIGNWEYNPDTGEIHWSDEMYRIFQLDPAAGPLTQEQTHELYKKYAVQGYQEAQAKVIEEGETVQRDIQMKMPDGSIKHLSSNIQPVKDADGRVVRVHGTLQDVTSWVQMREELQLYMQEMIQKQKTLSALNQAAQAVLRTRSLVEVYRVIGKEISELGYQVTVFKIDQQKHSLTHVHSTIPLKLIRLAEKLAGLSAGDYSFTIQEGGSFARVIDERQAVYVEDVAALIQEMVPPRVRGLNKKLAGVMKMDAAILVPLVVNQDLFSVLTVTASDLTLGDVPSIETFASQASIAIENALLITKLEETNQRRLELSRQLSLAQEEERIQLARELHDRVGQGLTAMSIDLNLANKQIDSGQLQSSKERIYNALKVVDHTAHTIRDVMADLRPPLLDDYGLLAAVRNYAEECMKSTEIQCEVRVIGESQRRLSAEKETVLFRIFQETATNILRHAGATRVNVTFAFKDGGLILLIEDDGVGFDQLLHPQEAQTSYGLAIMRERAESIGAGLSIESEPQKGTRIRVMVQDGNI